MVEKNCASFKEKKPLWDDFLGPLANELEHDS